MKKVKRKINKKKVVRFIVVVLLIVICSSLCFNKILKNNNSKGVTNKENNKYTYIQYGTLNEDTDLYINKNNVYEKVGTVSKGVNLEFSELKRNYLVTNINDIDYYIKVELVTESEKAEYDSRYKNYIVFNENVVTNDKTSFYDESGNLVYTINNSYNLPIIIKDDDKYGVEFDDRLLYIKIDSVKDVKENTNTDKTNSSGVGVLNYHFFYDESNEEDAKGCNEEICVSKSQFRSELEYFKKNNIWPIKSQELEAYIDGRIQLPKSVYITIDDGGRTSIAVDMLKEYQYYATIFLVTSWYNPSDYYTNEYIELHSHTENMHNQGDCSTGQGGGIQCLSEEEIQNDLKTSRDKLNGSTVIAYPFYEYNDYSIEMLKKAGFTMAFEGEKTGRDNLVHVGDNKYKLPRFVMVNYTTESDLNKYFSNIS